MNHKILFNLILALGLILVLGAGSSLAQETTVSAPASIDAVLGTAFTYQGRLTQGGNPVAGPCDFQFSLWNAASGGSQVGSTLTKTGVALTGGYFDAVLDFGASAFQGDARHLQIGLRCPAGGGSYTPLSGRVALNAAPYALSLRPGATIQSTGTALNLSSSATSGFALNVLATGTTAIYGQGAAATGAGVAGVNTNGASTASGVAGVNNGSGNGVFGQSVAGHGVHGKATNLTEGYGVYSEGNAYVDGKLFWQGKTGYVTISAAAFRPVNNSYNYTNWGNKLTPGNTSSSYYYAPVQLPHNATVTRLTFAWRDTSSSDVECKLFRNNLAGGGNEMARAVSSGAGGDGGSQDVTIDFAYVDNTMHAYYLEWHLPDPNTSGYGVIIEYTFYEPY